VLADVGPPTCGGVVAARRVRQQSACAAGTLERGIDMGHWTIGKRLVTGFTAVVAVMLAAGAFALWRVVAIRADADRVVLDALPGTALSGALGAAVKDNYIQTLRAAHAASPAALQQIEAESVTLRETIDRLVADYERRITDPEPGCAQLPATFDAKAVTRRGASMASRPWRC
jgi:hypothetical protein